MTNASAVVGVVFAQAARSKYTMADVYWPLALLVSSLLGMAVIVFFMKRWYEKNKSEEVGVSEFLTEARELEEEGELTREEYLKIKAKLAARLQGSAQPKPRSGNPVKRSNPPLQQNPPDQ